MSSKNGAPDQTRHVQKVIGYEIEFPFPPYGIQRSMMSRLSATLSNKENFLLESPTGTGKTLVLLCTTLAWQKKSKQIGQPLMSKRLRNEKRQERLERLRSKPCSCGRRAGTIGSEMNDLKREKDDLKKSKGSCIDQDVEVCEVTYQSNKKIKIDPFDEKLEASQYFNKSKPPMKQTSDPDCVIIDVSDDEDDKCAKSNVPTAFIPELSKKNVTNGNSDKEVIGDTERERCRNCEAIRVEESFAEVIGDSNYDGEVLISSKVKSSIPRIYYGTRTHKQITQVVRELNKTPYKNDLKMCILSARERACINDEVRDLPNRNDRCKELIKNRPDGPMSKSRAKSQECCPYYQDQNYVTTEFERINDEFKSEAWDIEDAAQFGRSRQICPYYGIRALQEQADITFCPYNYLLDPNIRKAMNINLKNAVVVFDEAHNIEDICRDSASFSIDTIQIEEILDVIKGASSFYVQGSTIMDAYQYFKTKLLDMSHALRNFQFDAGSNDRGDFLKKKVLMNDNMIDFMSTIGLGPQHLHTVKENIKALRGDDEQEGNDNGSKNRGSNEDSLLNNTQMQFIDQLCIALDFMYSESNKSLQDFRLVITEALDRAPPKRNGPLAPSTGPRDRHVWKLHLLCMNPGVTFQKIHSLAWSVIVASGTLSPTESLKSELGCTFPSVFEGAHVIKSDRIFATIISHGPGTGVELKCSYQETLKLEFQDEVGKILRDVCLKVPHGVLCFFPSYDRLETFYQRWYTTKIMASIQSRKKVFREQRNQSALKFEDELVKFNEHANRGGALLFAVFRGKVSEGIDFADKAARAVVTIGIPYPNYVDLQVGLKKDYNDSMRVQRPYLMTGGDWYAAQAFRALNQALGRCIRHKDDWGAIIMIDSRLNYGGNSKNISKWLRQVLTQAGDYSVLKSRLEEFVESKSDDGCSQFDIKEEF